MNDLLNKWTVLILGIWLICGIVSLRTKKSTAMECALWATFWIGIGYMVLKGKL
jgi:hypothetical protein